MQPGSKFDLTRPKPIIAEKIGLDGLYSEAIIHGVLIGRTLEDDPLDLLVFSSETTAFDQNQCETILKTKCKSIKYFGENIKKFSDNTFGRKNECQKFKQRFNEVTLLPDCLDEKRNLPTKQYCKVLEKSEDLRYDLRGVEQPFQTLRHHCAHLGIVEQLEKELQGKRMGDLDKFNSCMKILTKRCRGWSRNGKQKFTLACVASNATSTYLTQSASSKSPILGRCMQVSKVVEEANEDATKKTTCDF
ncbi:hypothetical protein PMAC_000267 [Pneumocystis sp. 'macacae']|nr:hypothetical protein PMAC_000267 [Pneumocystis sp. 'macacae']